MIDFNDLYTTIIDGKLVKSYFLRWYCFIRLFTMKVKDQGTGRLPSSPIPFHKDISNCSASSFKHLLVLFHIGNIQIYFVLFDVATSAYVEDICYHLQSLRQNLLAEYECHMDVQWTLKQLLYLCHDLSSLVCDLGFASI